MNLNYVKLHNRGWSLNLRWDRLISYGMTISAQGEISGSTPADNRGGESPWRESRKQPSPKLPRGLGSLALNQRKKKQNSGQVEFSVFKWDN